MEIWSVILLRVFFFSSRRILTVFEYSLGLLHRRSGVLFYLVICLRLAPQLRCKPYSSLADSKTWSITLNCPCRTVVETWAECCSGSNKPWLKSTMESCIKDGQCYKLTTPDALQIYLCMEPDRQRLLLLKCALVWCYKILLRNIFKKPNVTISEFPSRMLMILLITTFKVFWDLWEIFLSIFSTRNT